jgi:hypothetical protein
MTEALNLIVGTLIAWRWPLAALFLAAAAFAFFKRDSFLLTDFAYRFPFVGKLNRYALDYSEANRGKWLNVETALCHDYARHVTALSKSEFDKNSEYLRKAYDHGRKPMPLKIMALLTLLIAMEALGFSYLLSSWMSIESSQNERALLTFAIVCVLAAILVWVTHAAGQQLYRTRLLRSCFQQFQAQRHPDDSAPKGKVYISQIISLRENQFDDREQPQHVQCSNRVATTPTDHGSYAWVWVAAILIIFIAIISTILRIETLHSMPFVVSGGEGVSTQNARNLAIAREYAAISSFGILSAIFVVTQLVGVSVGYRYGFAGKQSSEAYRAINGCADYETYFAPVRRRMSIADLRLTTLHRLMEKRLPHEMEWKYDFLDFIREERQRGATDLIDPTNIDGEAPPATASHLNGSSVTVGSNGLAGGDALRGENLENDSPGASVQ